MKHQGHIHSDHGTDASIYRAVCDTEGCGWIGGDRPARGPRTRFLLGQSTHFKAHRLAEKDLQLHIEGKEQPVKDPEHWVRKTGEGGQ